MSTAVIVETVVADKPKRTRKTHNKVRTGCLTCKIRRKKCDEAKPFCNRCTSTGRKCDGYETVQATKPAASPSPPDSAIDVASESGTRSDSSTPNPKALPLDQSLKLWKPPRSRPFCTEDDFYCFDFFRNRTGPEFAAYFDESLWRSFVVRACFSDPTVLQAAAAVGAVHRRFELGISSEAFRFCDISTKQYCKALRSLNQNLSRNDPANAEVNMVASMLLCLFEVFQGNYDTAQSHFAVGIHGLLNKSSTNNSHRKTRILHAETSYKTASVGYESLHNFTDRLENLCPRLFKSPTILLANPSLDPTPPPLPSKFTSFAHARDVLITEGAYIWDSWLQLELGNLPDSFATQHSHVTRLLEWSVAYAEFNKSLHSASPTSPSSLTSSSSSSSNAGDKRIPHLLKSYREALHLVILTQIAFHHPDGAPFVPLCYPPETCTVHDVCKDYSERKSTLNAHFARLSVMTESLFSSDSGLGVGSGWSENSGVASEARLGDYSISVDSGIGPPLYLSRSGKGGCRSTKVRYQVTDLIAGDSVEELVWGKMGVYGVAERMGMIEEHAVSGAGVLGALGCGGAEDGGDGVDGMLGEVKWVDVTAFLEEGKVCVSSCREDELGGLRWRREWLAY